MTKLPHLDRRQFLGLSLLGLASLARPPRWLASERVRLCIVGVGGRGGSNLRALSALDTVEIAALCDVDERFLDRAAAAHPNAARLTDWRKLQDAKPGTYDAIAISTPDHTHAPIAAFALQNGLHVYCEKPLATDAAEVRYLAKLARETGKKTQMGIQIQSESAYRTAVNALQQGVIGRIQEVHSYVQKSWAGPVDGRPARIDPVPAHFHWDHWLGPAPARPYVKDLYHPAAWRGWRDFGTGTLGDMGCHLLDPIMLGLGLGWPKAVDSTGPAHGPETFAKDSAVRWQFAANERCAEGFFLRWTDGAAAKDLSRADLPIDYALPGAGSVVIGESGTMVLPHWAQPSFFRAGEAFDPKITILPSLNHHAQWIDAIREGGEPGANFDYAAKVTAIVLLGVRAAETPGEVLRFDAEGRGLDDRSQQALAGRPYRKGYEQFAPKF